MGKNKISESKDKLTEQQQKAVEYTDSPLLIVAGPGTGKTRVLTEKVLYLVTDKGYNPNRILVSTFTIKAANELKERLRKKLGDKVETMQISTIHSFCQKMLLSFPDQHNFGNVFAVLDELDQFMYVNKNIWNYGLKEYMTDLDIDEIINFYNRATENDVDPEELIKYFKKQGVSEKDHAIAKSYSLYLANLLNPNDTKLDFALLQREFFYMIRNKSEVLQKVRDMFDYILIDEYQDTNPIQDAIFRLITEPKYGITVVGDEDQSIYGFRGASIENFRAFLQRYPGAKKLELEENFRSVKEIVKTFDDFMKYKRTFTKSIYTNNSDYSKPIIILSKNLAEEGKTIVEFINRLVNEHGVKYGDIAILFKSVRFNSEHVQNELEKKRIPFIPIGDSSLMSQESVLDMLILLGYVTSFETDEYFKNKILILRNIVLSNLLNLTQESRDKLILKVDLMEPFKVIDSTILKRLGLPERDIDILLALKNIRKEQMTGKLSLLKLFYKVLDATGYHAGLFLKGDEQSLIEVSNLAKFSVLLNKFENITGSRDFKSLLYHLTTIPDNKMEDASTIEDNNAVKLMTIHQAKGLEFPVVIMAGVTKNRYNKEQENDSFIIEIPKELMLDKSDFSRGEELQRTFYVGLSRAQKILAISTVDGPGSKPSPFIDEIGHDNFIKISDFNKELDLHYKPIKEKTHLSYSSVGAYIDCAFRFYLWDILNFQTPEAYFQTYGVIIHNCLKKIHVFMKEKKEIKLQQIIEIVDTYCKDDESRQRWRDELITDIWNYYEKTPAFIGKIVDVELPFSFIDSDVVINGYVDLVIENKNNELEIIDYKSRYKEGIELMNVGTQLRMYNMALNSRYPNGIKKISAYTFKDNQQVFFENSEKDIKETEKLVKSISESIEKKKFKRNWKGRFCITKTGKCNFYGLCHKLEGGKDE